MRTEKNCFSVYAADI